MIWLSTHCQCESSSMCRY